MSKKSSRYPLNLGMGLYVVCKDYASLETSIWPLKLDKSHKAADAVANALNKLPDTEMQYTKILAVTLQTYLLEKRSVTWLREINQLFEKAKFTAEQQKQVKQANPELISELLMELYQTKPDVDELVKKATPPPSPTASKKD